MFLQYLLAKFEPNHNITLYTSTKSLLNKQFLQNGSSCCEFQLSLLVFTVYEISFPRNPEGSNSTATWKSHAFLCVVVMAKQYDVLFRLLMLGDSGVGKTCMLRRFTESEFHPSHISTIGVDFKMKTLELDGLKVRVQIWDTAGQERYQTITKQYYRRAQGIIFVYDITNEPSFQHLVKWASDVDEYAPDKVQRILVGNKSDEELGRQVTKDQGSKLAETYGMEFFETSASTSSNISESFTRVTELVLQAHKRDEDNLLGSLDDYLENAALEEEIGSEGTDDNTKNTCAC